MIDQVLRETILVRYGVIPEVAKFRVTCAESLARDAWVVVRTHRGLELGQLLQDLDHRYARETEELPADETVLLRPASPEDLKTHRDAKTECEREFSTWGGRITQWNLQLELVDLEWMLDRKKLVLYVLNERGPDCTKLALQAAAAGLGSIEVQPVDAQGLVQLEPMGGGCGSGGCGTGGCH